MAQQSRPRTKAPKELPAPAAAFMAGNGEGIETAMESQRAVMDGVAEIGQEVMTFMGHRLQEDMEVSRSLMACTTPEEAFHVQCRFAETATREYFDQARKVMEMAARVARDSWAPVERSTPRR